MVKSTGEEEELASFLLDHPVCCFCGGGKPATTEEHIPARAFFYGRRWPEGYSFPACESYNAASKASEAVAAVICRGFPDRRDGKEADELRRQVEGIRNNDWATFDEMTNPAIKARFVREGSSLILPESFVKSVPLIHIGPRVHAHLDSFAQKLIKALHYKHTANIVPIGATLLKSVYTNLSVMEGHGPPKSFEGLRSIPKLERDRHPIRDINMA